MCLAAVSASATLTAQQRKVRLVQDIVLPHQMSNATNCKGGSNRKQRASSTAWRYKNKEEVADLKNRQLSTACMIVFAKWKACGFGLPWFAPV